MGQCYHLPSTRACLSWQSQQGNGRGLSPCQNHQRTKTFKTAQAATGEYSRDGAGHIRRSAPWPAANRLLPGRRPVMRFSERLVASTAPEDGSSSPAPVTDRYVLLAGQQQQYDQRSNAYKLAGLLGPHWVSPAGRDGCHIDTTNASAQNEKTFLKPRNSNSISG